jgi:UDPglucose 6-dehydrogenase
MNPLHSVSVIGTGFVGLVTGACLSEFGLRVLCMDSDAARVRELECGIVPFYEPGLAALITKNVAAGRLGFTADIAAAAAASEVVFIAVPTPSGEDGSADLRHVRAAADAVARHMTGYKVIVIKSTVPVGTARGVREAVRAAAAGRGLAVAPDVVSNPEFLREGSAVRDFMHPDRVVIGGDGEKSVEAVRDIYNVLYLIETPFIFTSFETAELIKYASNAFLATKIGFINEVAGLCDAVGADVRDVAKAMGMDGRIGKYFLHPGPGFGGSCLPKDARALAGMGRERGARMSIVEAVVAANASQRRRMVEKIEARMGPLAGKVVGVLGLAFKQGTDDVRESSATAIVLELAGRGARVKVFDPAAMENARKGPFAGLESGGSAGGVGKVESGLGGGERAGLVESDGGAGAKAIAYCADEYEAAAGADGVVVLTEWNQFRHLDLARIAGAMRGRHLFDFRNIFEPEDAVRAGLIYDGVGRGRCE